MASKKSKRARRAERREKSRQKPRILILEGLSGSSRCVARAGGVGLPADPHVVSPTISLLESDVWHGLLLTGGGDLNPRLYGQKKINKKVYGVNETRDRTEIVALSLARERNLPVLGICRGAQMINVAEGGTLYQHIGNHHSGGVHWVDAEEDSFLGDVAGEEFRVVSLHHQAVKTVAPGLRVAARGLDDTIEAVESIDGRCLGVQFHPEEDSWAPYARGIFRWLVVEAAKRAGLPVPPKPEYEPSRLGFAGSWYHDWDLDKEWSGMNEEDDPVLQKDWGKGYAQSKNRQAGVKTLPKASSPVTYRYFCRCHGLEFDRIEDRDDHEVMFGGEGA